MKIGIMSMQRVLNYGSYMQALSLKRIIEEIGYHVEFVDYRPSANIENRGLKQRLVFSLKRVIKDNCLYNKLRPMKKDERAEKFASCYQLLGISEKKQYSRRVDLLIIGSDEVFNCLQVHPQVGYCLELFGKNQKARHIISYAASFGSTTLEKLEYYGVTEEVRKYLKKFNAISIRDKNSRLIINSLCGINAEEHLDPVLVGDLERQPWKEIQMSNYVLVYGYKGRFTKEEGIAIQKYAHDRNLITISLGEEQEFCDEIIICSPDEVLSYFKNAECVVTDTFHGTIFSVINHKDVAVFCRSVDARKSTNEEKLLDLMSKLKLEDRVVKQVSEVGNILDTPIDFSYIDKFRERERKRTIRYLKMHCKGN